MEGLRPTPAVTNALSLVYAGAGDKKSGNGEPTGVGDHAG